MANQHWATELFDEPSCHQAEHARRPRSANRDETISNKRALLIKRRAIESEQPSRLGKRVTHDLLPLHVCLFELLRICGCLCAALSSQQIERGSRVANTAGCIDARRQSEAHHIDAMRPLCCRPCE
jgi:hypothetical protein